LTHTLLPVQPPDRFVVWKKKSGLPNIVNDGVRFGSAFTMCSVFSSTVSARRTAIGTTALAYGFGAVALPTSCSSFRSTGLVRSGWPFA